MADLNRLPTSQHIHQTDVKIRTSTIRLVSIENIYAIVNVPYFYMSLREITKLLSYCNTSRMN